MKLLLSLAVAIVAASPLGAKTIKAPEKEPAFSFNLPEGWTIKSVPNGDFDPMRERETNNKVRIFSVTLHMVSPGGVKMVQVFAGFVPRAGRYFLLGSVASAEAHHAHEKAMNEILDSIKPVAASEDD